ANRPVAGRGGDPGGAAECPCGDPHRQAPGADPGRAAAPVTPVAAPGRSDYPNSVNRARRPRKGLYVMPIAEKDVRWVQEPKMGRRGFPYLPAVFQGLTTTVRHMFQPKVTEMYPEQEPDLPPNYRGVHRLNRDPDGRVKCVACYMCATACPAHCIDIV